MDPYDTAATRAVWDRVLRTQEEPEEATIEDVLRARIAAEKTNRLTYLALARCAGPYAGTLRVIAAQEGQHAQTLSALYFLHTGECFEPESAARCEGTFCDRLRAQFLGEMAGEKQYRADAERWPEHRCLFLRLAQEESRHAQMLHELTCRMLRR